MKEAKITTATQKAETTPPQTHKVLGFPKQQSPPNTKQQSPPNLKPQC